MSIGAINPNSGSGATNQATTNAIGKSSPTTPFPDPSKLDSKPKVVVRGGNALDAHLAKIERLVGQDGDISFGSLRFRLAKQNEESDAGAPAPRPGWDGETKAPNPATTPLPGQRLDTLR